MIAMLRLLLAIGLLAIALTFDNNWPGLGIKLYSDLSIELFVLLALGLWHVSHAPHPRNRERRLSLWAAVLTMLVLLHYLNVTVQGLFGRAFNLYWDGRHVPRVLVMAATHSATWQVLAVALAAAAGLLLLYRVCRWALTTFFDAMPAGVGSRAVSAGLAGFAVLLSAFGLLGPTPYRDHVLTPLSYTYGKQLLLVAAAFTPGASDRFLAASPAFDGGLSALAGADVMIVFAESYGVSTFENQEFADVLQPARRQLAEAVAESGRFAASALVTSPTFGGGSWLTHAALLAGVDMRVPDHHALLLQSTRPTLVGHFRKHGYRSVALMPGLHSAWPEGAYYGFDQIYDAASLAYTGPAFGFWRIPDQFSMGRLHQLELADTDGRPRFIVFPTITSHLPFEPVPPVVADWTFAYEGAAPAGFNEQLDPATVQELLNQIPDWQRLQGPYLRSIDYSLRWLSEYLRQLAPRPMLMLIVGDHQPAATVVGRDADWSVPVHVVSTSKPLIDSFVASGFVEGLVPQRPVLGPMHGLTASLLAILDGCSSTGNAHKCPPSASPRLTSTTGPPGSARNTSVPLQTDIARRTTN